MDAAWNRKVQREESASLYHRKTPFYEPCPSEPAQRVPVLCNKYLQFKQLVAGNASCFTQFLQDRPDRYPATGHDDDSERCTAVRLDQARDS